MVIEFQHISKMYTMGSVEVPALQDVSMAIEPGEYVSIMGPSGSGKSTMMNILGCLDTPSEGLYLLNDRPVSQLNDDQLAEVRNRSIGFVFQTFNLLSADTALNNVALPMLYAGTSLEKRQEAARKALEAVGLSHRINHHPTEMSGGERQRVAIARALVNDPPIILADEPTGNLDSRTGKEIMHILVHLHDQGKTIVLVTHDPAVARHAPRLIRIRDGRVESDERTNR